MSSPATQDTVSASVGGEMSSNIGVETLDSLGGPAIPSGPELPAKMGKRSIVCVVCLIFCRTVKLLKYPGVSSALEFVPGDAFPRLCEIADTVRVQVLRPVAAR